jgi:hypothetical protein
VAFKFLNVLILNIAEKLLAGRETPINQSINQSIKVKRLKSQQIEKFLKARKPK